MVKVREDHPIKQDGTVDLDSWLLRLQEMVEVENVEELKNACELSKRLEEEAIAAENIWSVGTSSFRTGLEMAEILADLQMDQESLVAAVLYRSVREGKIELNAIKEQYGSVVAKLIDGALKMAVIGTLLNISDNNVLGKQTSDQLESVRKMLVALVDDVRVALIKLAERTCAIRAVKDVREEKRKKVAREVFDVYAPLAHRLGIGHIKWELEDLSFRYLEPEDYKRIASLLDEKRVDREKYIRDVIATLKVEIENAGIKAEYKGRAKHIYSIWRKMRRKNIGFSQVYDVRAVRILVPEIKDCYAVLGILHNLWRSIPNEFDDYIASPKENGYRSLHTAVIGPNAKVLEVQIRTSDMHDEAEYGVCAHWRYKGTDKTNSRGSYEERIAWLRQVLDWHEEMGGLSGLAEQLSIDVIQDRIYVFTPDGHVVDLAADATPLDFAYHVHTEVGHRCRGAKVNGRIVPLTYKLQTSDQVEILTGNVPAPSRNWLDRNLGYITTSRARAKIVGWFKRQDREKNRTEGKALVRKEFKRLALNAIDMKSLCEKLGFDDPEEMYVAIGTSDLSLDQVLNAAQGLVVKAIKNDQLSFPLSEFKEQNRIQKNDIEIEGVGSLLTRFASCCKPVPGDAIMGYITVGRGVSVHRQDCGQFLQLQEDEPERIIEVHWAGKHEATYPVDIVITAYDRYGLLRDITTLFDGERINILALNTLTNRKENSVNMVVTIEITTLNLLSRVLNRLGQIPNVISASRKD